MPTSNPLVSVIMASYNRARLLPRAVESLHRQSYRTWELVLVDDGSTDKTASVVACLAAADPRIRVQSQANLGLSAARNAGLAVARGEYLTFLDSDDEYHRDHLALRVDYMLRHPMLHMVHGGVCVVGGPHTVPDLHDTTRRIPIADCAVGGTFFMQEQVPRRLGGFRLPDFGDDYEFLRRAIRAFKVGMVHFPTYIYHREEPDSMCNLAARKR